MSRQRSIRDVLGQKDRFQLRFAGGPDSYVSIKGADAAGPWTAEFWVRRDGPVGSVKAAKPGRCTHAM